MSANINYYPSDIRELDLDAVEIKPDILRAAQRFAAARPWRGDLRERQAKFAAAADAIAKAAGIQPPRVIFGNDEREDSGRSCFVPAANIIILRGRLSVVTLLHELAHAKFGRSERTAVAWSLAIFRAAFPRSFARLTFRGHMAVARQRPQS